MRYKPKFRFEKKPMVEEKYWFINNEGEPVRSGVSPFADKWDINRWKAGNCFKTRVQALEGFKVMKKALMQYHKSIK